MRRVRWLPLLLLLAACPPADPVPQPHPQPVPTPIGTIGRMMAFTGPGEPPPPGALRRYSTARVRHGRLRELAFVGGSLLSAAAEGPARLWKLPAGELAAQVALGPVRAVATGAPILAHAHPDHATVTLVDATTGAEIRSFEPAGAVRRLALSGDGKRLAVADDDGKVTVVDCANGAVLGSFAAAAPEYLVLDATGKRVAVAGRRGPVAVRGADGGVVVDVPASADLVGLAFGARGDLVVSDEDRFRVVRPADGTVLAEVETKLARAFASGGGVIAVALGLDKLGRWSEEGVLLRLDDVGDRPDAVAVDASGKLVAFGMGGGTIRVVGARDLRDRVPAGAHSRGVRRVAISSKGRFVASAGRDGNACLWERESAALLRCFGDGDDVVDVAFSPDDRRLAFVDRGGRLSIRSVPDGGEKLSIFIEGAGRAIAWAPDGRRLAVAESDGAFLHDAATGARVARIDRSENLQRVAFAPDGKTLLLADHGSLTFWDVATETWRARVEVADLDISDAAYSHDGRRIATVASSTLKIVDAGTGLVTLSVEGLGWDTLQTAWSADDVMIAVGGQDEEAWLLDAASGAVRHRLPGHDGTVRAFAFAPGVPELLTGSDDATLLAFDLTPEVLAATPREPVELTVERIDPVKLAAAAPLPSAPKHVPSGCAAPVRDRNGDPLPRCAVARAGTQRWRAEFSIDRLAFSADGALLVAGGSQLDSVHVWEVKSGAERNYFAHDFGGAGSLSFTPDGKRVVAAGFFGGARVWELAHGTLTDRFGISLALSNDTLADTVRFDGRGRLVAAGRETIFVRDVAAHRMVLSQPLADPPFYLSIGPGGRMLLSGAQGVRVLGADGRPGNTVAPPTWQWARFTVESSVVALDVDRGGLVASDLTGGDPVDIPAMPAGGHPTSIDVVGSTLAVLTVDGDVRFFQLPSLQAAGSLAVPGSQALAMSPDGSTLATAWENAVRLWDVKSGARVGIVAGHEHWVEAVGFDATGRLATVGADQIVRFWDRSQGAPLGERASPAYRGLGADGAWLASTDAKTSVEVVELASGRATTLPYGKEGTCDPITTSHDGKTVACFEFPEHVRLRGARSKALRLRESTLVEALAFAADDRFLAVARSGGIEIFEVKSGGRRVTIDTGDDRSDCLAFAPDSKLLAVCRGSVLELWTVPGGRRVAAAEAPAGLYGAAWSPDGKRVATGSLYGDVIVFDAEHSTVRAVLTGHRAVVETVAFSRDGAVLASGSRDGTALVWDATKL
jgi:WD40 repeat protein